MNKYGLLASMKATEGNGEQLSKILLQAAELMRSAKGCHMYVVGLDEEDQDTVSLVEIWDSKVDHDESLKLPGVSELIGQAMPLLAGPPAKGAELKVVGGLGLE